MTLIDNVKEKLAQNNPDIVFRKMGYPNPKRAKKRLLSLLEAPDIESWLKRSSFDFHYSGKEFLRKLFEVLSLPLQPLEKELTRIDEKDLTLLKMKQPYILIDTPRPCCSSRTLAMLEGQRRLRIDKEAIYSRSLDEVLNMVDKIIREHYEKHKGELEIWGKIRRYLYRHGDGSLFVFDIHGNLLPFVQNIKQEGDMARLYGKPVKYILEV
ncbi:hypothetical protein [Nitratiruptor sp. YY09-18]|uniref:hypothetical protein n=1 Tax=Nitratiruptor sp. YY09-18 TaxID=2724901 RepID=UPI001916A26E|nr:hypothetical protein [Nitratiruptor sp. YY09-18]BCD68465.1 hypothetical protein NitYY0918_C1380 [Nitratiruptor sp. YY09-18]